MASVEKRLPDNAPGDFYVDSTCIDCGTCRWVAPASFDRGSEQSRVYRQPQAPAEIMQSLKALVACPTASIGTQDKQSVASGVKAFPDLIADNVYYCGFASPDSFGAASYLVVRPQGNVLIDSPRFAAPLVAAIERMGGVRWMFLTHQDDVADHAKFAAKFGCDRVMHEADIGNSTREVERQFSDDQPFKLDDELLVIPTPGHTRGSACLLYRDKFLFTGDHLAWSKRLGHIYGFRDACWYDWGETVRSTQKLAAYSFEHLLPGHGWPWRGTREQAREQMVLCLKWMGADSDAAFHAGGT